MRPPARRRARYGRGDAGRTPAQPVDLRACRACSWTWRRCVRSPSRASLPYRRAWPGASRRPCVARSSSTTAGSPTRDRPARIDAPVAGASPPRERW